jgi:hypothetical protein
VFVRNVLADGQITAAEYGEAVQGLADCYSAGGLHPVLQDAGLPGVKYVATTDDQAPPAVIRQCGEDWDGGILDLYSNIVQNPEKQPLSDLRAACLVHLGVVPEGLTGTELDELLDKQTVWAKCSGDVCVTTPPIDPNVQLPGGRDLDGAAPDIAVCMRSPLQVMQTSSPIPWPAPSPEH